MIQKYNEIPKIIGYLTLFLKTQCQARNKGINKPEEQLVSICEQTEEQ